MNSNLNKLRSLGFKIDCTYGVVIFEIQDKLMALEKYTNQINDKFNDKYVVFICMDLSEFDKGTRAKIRFLERSVENWGVELSEHMHGIFFVETQKGHEERNRAEMLRYHKLLSGKFHSIPLPEPIDDLPLNERALKPKITANPYAPQLKTTVELYRGYEILAIDEKSSN